MDLSQLRVLCIEDSPDDFLLVEHALRIGGVMRRCQRVDTVEALTEALALQACDIVLSDYAVPGMNFTDTMRRFLHHHPDLPLILVSGTIGEVKARVMVEVGAWDFVPKSDLGRLVPAVMQAVRRAAMRRGRPQRDSAAQNSERSLRQRH
jgi:DNA-binding NtrC family response regulator